MKKVTKKELEKLQGYIKGINQAQLAIGTIELQKHAAIKEAKELIEMLRSAKQELQNKYNCQDIDLATGKITNADN
jgi:hypothetical protein